MARLSNLFKTTFSIDSSAFNAQSLSCVSPISKSKIMRNQSRLNEFATILNEQIAVGGLRIDGQYSSEDCSSVERKLRNTGNVLVAKSLLKKTALCRQDEVFLKLHSDLRKPETWEGMATNLTGEQQYLLAAELKPQWFSHANFSHCTPAALMAIAKNIQQFAQEFKRIEAHALRQRVNRQSEKDYDFYLAYLESYKNTLRRYQKEIAESLAIRITNTLKAGDLSAHEPLAALKRVLKANGVNLPLLSLEFEQKTSFLNLAHAYEYGLRRGHASLKEQLLQELKNPAFKFPLTIIRRGRVPFLIPESISELIPKNPPRFPRLNRGRAFRYQWLAVQQDLITKLHMSAHIKPPRHLDWDLNDRYYQNLMSLITELSTSHKSSSAQLKRHLRKSKSQILARAWQEMLHTQQILLIHRSLAYFSQLITMPKPLDLFINGVNPLNEARFSANAKLMQLKQTIIQLNDKELLNKWQFVNQSVGKKLLPDAVEMNLKHGLQHFTTTDNPMSTKAFDKLYFELMRFNQSTDCGILTAFNSACLKLVSVFNQEITRIKDYLIAFSPTQPEANLIRFNQTVKLLRQLAISAESSTVLLQLETRILEALESYQVVIQQQTVESLAGENIQVLHHELLQCCYSFPQWKACQSKLTEISHYHNLKKQGLSPQYKEEQFKRLDNIHNNTAVVLAESQQKLDALSASIQQRTAKVRALRQAYQAKPQTVVGNSIYHEKVARKGQACDSLRPSHSNKLVKG